jgi:hypothetical protein
LKSIGKEYREEGETFVRRAEEFRSSVTLTKTGCHDISIVEVYQIEYS